MSSLIISVSLILLLKFTRQAYFTPRKFEYLFSGHLVGSVSCHCEPVKAKQSSFWRFIKVGSGLSTKCPICPVSVVFVELVRFMKFDVLFL